MGRGTLGRGAPSGRSGGASSGGGWIELEDTSAIVELAKMAAPETFEAVRSEMGKLYATAYRLWPVKTGFSKASMALLTRVKRDALAESLVVRAPYAYYVRSKQLGKNAAKALVLDPANELADRLATRIAEGIANGNR